MASKDQPDISRVTSDEIQGLPSTLPTGTQALLYDAGRQLAIASGQQLTIFRLETERAPPQARELCVRELPGQTTALAESVFGLVIAVDCSDRWILLLLQDNELITIYKFTSPITALAAGGSQAYVVVAEREGRGARLVQINLRQRAIVAERPLERSQVRLAADHAGRQVVVTDPVDRQVTPLDAALQPVPAPFTPTRSLPPAGSHECCCCPCKPAAGGDAASPHTPPGEPPTDGATPPDQATSQDPATRVPGYKGESAVPSGNGGTVVGAGDRVEHHPPPGAAAPWAPCGRNLFYTVHDVRQLGIYFLASDRQSRRVSLLSADMNLLDEWSFGRAGAIVLAAQGVTTMVMHDRSMEKWILRDAHQIVSKYRSDVDIPVLLPPENKTFIGQRTYALSHGQQPSPTAIKGLLLPIVEGDQAYSSPNLNGFGAYMDRTMLPPVRDYYDENSFGMLKDVNVSVFGVNVGPVGGPLKLPRRKLADYYFPAYDPARVELVKSSATYMQPVTFDGRESLTIEARPLTGGPQGGKLTFPFFALGLQRDSDFFPFQIKFLGNEKLTLQVTMPDSSAETLGLAFTAKTIDISDALAIPAKMTELAGYLDGVMQAAETTAGIATRLFAAPQCARIPQIGKQFGRLLVTFAAAVTSGNKLRVLSSMGSHPGGDPIGLTTPILGTIPAGNTGALSRLLANAALLAQEKAGFGYNARLLKDPTCSLDGGTQKLSTFIAISDRNGGPGAEVKLIGSSGLEALFDTSSSKPNSATTSNNAQALRDRTDLYRDAYSAALERLRLAGQPVDSLKQFGCVLIMPVEPATPNPADADAVLPSEVWNVTPLYRPFAFRGAENITTVVDRNDPKVQLQSAWALVFTKGGKPDNPLICHELGHAIGYADLYFQDGYRDELAYMNSWALMDSHDDFSHHCGYHKLQSGWFPEGARREDDYGRVFPLGLPLPDAVRTWEFLLVPIELWRDSLAVSARAAFGVDNKFPLAQLASIDFGGDGATFGLIEARQRGARFSRNLPIAAGGILITNGITWTLDERFATNGWYRRPLQLLNPNDILRNPGDSFDLAMAPELPVKGTKVEIVDRKIVEGDTTVYRVKVSRENADFIDLYFDSPPIYYKNPDLWIDWAGNNKPNADSLTPDFSIGQPSDQGEAIRVHPSRPEHHWAVARLRNRGKVKALDVKLNFFYFEPPGAGDGRKPLNVKDTSHYKLIGSTTMPEVPGSNDPRKALVRWDVPAGFKGHTCILVQIEDYKIPEDSQGGALGSDDVWQVNNHAQKNVDRFEALSASPFTPIEFEFSVHNDGVSPEFAYPEPDGLPYGMKLSVIPPHQTIASGGTVIFQCKLELDETIIRTGCQNDQRFHIHAWRQDPESSIRWGGVEYEIRPREKTVTQLQADWDSSQNVTFNGVISPYPGGGTVQIRVDFQNQQARWIAFAAGPGGKFSWTGRAPDGSFEVEGIAWFEGNRKFGSSRSNPAYAKHPPIIR